MKKVSLAFIATILGLSCFGQIEFGGKPINQYQFKDDYDLQFYNQIDSLFKLDKTYDFEFRLWINLESVIRGRRLFILSNYKGKFSARYFKEVPSIEHIQELPPSKEQADALWFNLLANKILLLPTQDSLKSKMIRYTMDYRNFRKEPVVNGLYLSDGNSYKFELLTKEKFRRYEYNNPDSYLKEYPQTEEFYRAYVIISLVRDFLESEAK